MLLAKKTSIYPALFFLFLFSTSIQLYSQEQLQETILYQILGLDKYQALHPIVYPDTVILYSPFLPIIADGKHLNVLNRSLVPECQITKPLFPPLRLSTHRLFADVYHRNELYRQAYDSLIKNNIAHIRYTAADFSGKVEKIEEIPSNIFQFLFKIDYDLDRDKIARPERFHPKRRYWIYNGNHKVQLSQNYISQNWYNGGVRNLNLINQHNVSFNYSKNKFQTNNYAEWKLNIFTNPNDTLRLYRIADDLVRTYSTFGIQAFHNWYYSSFLEIKSQLFQNFVENTDQVLASAFSPLYINAGILGMRYQIEKKNPNVKGGKMNFNMDISPLSIQYTGVFNKDKGFDQTRFGIKSGKWHLTNIGSTLNSKIVIDFNKNVNFASRFSFFTNYEKITTESENTLNMPINRYFSTTLYLYVRYDNNKQLKMDPTWGHFQINELISFGFNYNW
ncbi:MAG: DUF3078 domain-containing protein [Candidatus Azobacteroides sp.]|nr:DUF3078 domain-containing protein [Candidatus Azobacteroides sp.]